MSAIKAALAVSQRVRGGVQLSQIRIRPDVEPADQFEIFVQHLVKIPVLMPCFCQNHRKMQRNCPDIEASYKNRLVPFICRVHPAPFKPGG